MKKNLLSKKKELCIETEYDLHGQQGHQDQGGQESPHCSHILQVHFQLYSALLNRGMKT